jgi:diacylglycerol kinase (ATP)
MKDVMTYPPAASERALIIFNPVAGGADAPLLQEIIERHFAASNWSYELHETSPDEDTVKFVREAVNRGFSLVVAAGGDGTVSCVAEGLLRSEIPVGILPVGTTNTLAQELNIPLNVDEACRLLIGEHAVMCLDSMQVGEQAFFLHISIDLFSLTIKQTERAAKRRFGRVAYLWTALKQWLGYQPCRFILSIDGQPPQRLRAASVFITNIGAVGMPPFNWGPHIRPDDGQLDICIVKAQSFLDYLKVIRFALLGQRLRNPHIKYLTAKHKVVVFANRPLPVQGDGEIIGETSVEVKVIPHAIQLIVPLELGENSSNGVKISPKLV